MLEKIPILFLECIFIYRLNTPNILIAAVYTRMHANYRYTLCMTLLIKLEPHTIEAL